VFFKEISEERSKELAEIVIKKRKNKNMAELKKMGADQVKHHSDFEHAYRDWMSDYGDLESKRQHSHF
jgi:antirestriction protein